MYPIAVLVPVTQNLTILVQLCSHTEQRYTEKLLIIVIALTLLSKLFHFCLLCGSLQQFTVQYFC